MRTVEHILAAAESELPGNFVVYRALPRRELRRVGGFVFLDHFDQRDVTPELFDVPPHPHIGLQTVTYLFEGEIYHTDSLDNERTIKPGDVNWMTAGRGITHAEQVTTTQPRIHGLQSWVGLPHDKRKVDPAFEHFAAPNLPTVTGMDFDVKVIAGQFEDLDSPIPTLQDLVYSVIAMDKDAYYEFRVDPDHELAIYVCEGSILVGNGLVQIHDLAKLSIGDRVGLTAVEDTKLILFGGEPLPEPTVIYWNFITDTVGEAKQAAIDWQDGKFPAVSKYRKFTSADIGDEAERMQLL